MERFSLPWEAVWDGLPLSLLVVLVRQPAARIPLEDPPDAPDDAEAESARRALEASKRERPKPRKPRRNARRQPA